MFKVQKTQHVLAVNDLDSAEKYFIDTLGFKLHQRIDGWSFLYLDTFYLMVGHCHGEMLAKETNNHSLFAYVNCEGIDELYQQYKERGVKFNQHVADKPWGIREFCVECPEGHRILFGQMLNANNAST